MLSSLSGSGIACKLELDIIKSPSTSWASSPSSSSSTLSESSNSPVVGISTRKPRTPRKRPNQTYHEAAVLLSTAYPNIFSATLLNPPRKFSTRPDELFSTCPEIFSTRPDELFSTCPDEIFSVRDGSCVRGSDSDRYLLHSPVERSVNRRASVPCSKLLAKSQGEIESNSSRLRFGYCEDFENDFEDGFDSESILDGEIEEGAIDRIMGKLNESNDSGREQRFGAELMRRVCYGFPIGMGLIKAIKNVDNGDWWRFPSVNVVDITPKAEKSPPAPEKKKKKKKLAEIRVTEKESSSSSAQTESGNPKEKSGLLLKLNYDGVLTEWMDRPSPFSEEGPCNEATGNDVQARLTQIDLFSDSGVREASVLRYKEKRRTRLFSKKIRYQVRKVNADRRPRMKGRFVKSPNSPDDSEQG